MSQAQRAIDSDERLRRVRDYVRNHIEETIRLEDGAREAALSRTYFSAYFRRRTGVGFLRWLQSLRVQRAQALMRSASLTLTEIGYRAGFKDSRTFQRTFKRYQGDCPSAKLERS